MDVLAEWPGLVKEIHIGVGDEVTEGDELLTLESMKMLTPVPSPANGRVTAIHVALEDYVDAEATLLTLE
ncbi:MAG: acetyl-CoA carboxylase biotin carboxyl carrier protein subunit [Dehalococcoidia bacterium]|nr:acetyl-CoA carboxylase biotin carboxyl carrier protein subunit [Dehalococcoidia bacterium]